MNESRKKTTPIINNKNILVYNKEQEMSKLNLIVHPVKKEFRKEKCGFDHTPADDFVKSQWQSRSKSIMYLVYRWLIALFFSAVVIESMFYPDEPANFWLYFIFMTNWGAMMCMATNLLGAILVTTWHLNPEYADKLLNMESLTSPFRVYWGMHIISLVLSIVITIIYWSLLYDAEKSMISVTNITTHILNSIFMFIDLLIVAHPLRLLHMFLPVLYGSFYAIFSFIYQINGGVNNKGMPYIYHVIDWRKPYYAFLTVIAVLMLTCIVYMVLFSVYKLRTFIYRRIYGTSFMLPTLADELENKNTENGLVAPNLETTLKESNGVQHTPAKISMVFGQYTTYNNSGFNSNDESIYNY